jgi:hypothetical protein
MKRYRFAKIIFLVIVVAPLAIFIFGQVIMLLWNNVLSPVLHVSTITFWQGLGILVLCKILFGGFARSGASRRDHWKQRMMWKQMTEEQKEKFRQEWRSRAFKWAYVSRQNESNESGSSTGVDQPPS